MKQGHAWMLAKSEARGARRAFIAPTRATKAAGLQVPAVPTTCSSASGVAIPKHKQAVCVACTHKTDQG